MKRSIPLLLVLSVGGAIFPDRTQGGTVKLLDSVGDTSGAVTAEADPVYGPYAFQNNTNQTVYNLETTWNGTGGINKVNIVSDDGTGGQQPDIDGNMITLSWTGGLAVGGKVSFTIDCVTEPKFATGNWTTNSKNNGPGDIVVGPASLLPEPSTWILMSTALVGLLGYGWRTRRVGVLARVA